MMFEGRSEFDRFIRHCTDTVPAVYSQDSRGLGQCGNFSNHHQAADSAMSTTRYVEQGKSKLCRQKCKEVV